MKINCQTAHKIVFDVVQILSIYIFIILCSSKFAFTSDSFKSNSSKGSLNLKIKSPKLIQSTKNHFLKIPFTNCLSVVSKFENLVNFLDLNLSFYDFQQIINLKSGDSLYFGKKIVQEDSTLILTYVKRPVDLTGLLISQTDWYLNANLLIDNSVKSEQNYVTKTGNSNKKSLTYQRKQFFCKNLNLVVYKLIIKKVEFSNTGEYQCVQNGYDITKEKKYFVQVLISDWDKFNFNFLTRVNYDILIRNQSLIKYCPFFSPIWYKWSTKLNYNVNKSTIAINESGIYFCRSESLNRQINFYIFGN